MTDQSQHCVECERLAGELEALRAVVEAACGWREVYVSDADDEWNPRMAGLQRAVDAYRNSKEQACDGEPGCAPDCRRCFPVEEQA